MTCLPKVLAGRGSAVDRSSPGRRAASARRCRGSRGRDIGRFRRRPSGKRAAYLLTTAGGCLANHADGLQSRPVGFNGVPLRLRGRPDAAAIDQLLHGPRAAATDFHWAVKTAVMDERGGGTTGLITGPKASQKLMKNGIEPLPALPGRGDRRHMGAGLPGDYRGIQPRSQR